MELGPIFRTVLRNKVRFGLIILEIALTLAIVSNCVTMILDARGQMAKPSGFDDDNLITIKSTPFDARFKEQGYADNVLADDLRALEGVLGVRAVTNTNFVPWQGGGSSTEVKPLGSPLAMLRTQAYPVSAAFTETLDIQVIEGRGFTPEDVDRDTRRLRDLFASKREVGTDSLPLQKFTQDVVLTEAFAKLAFSEGPYVGKLLEDSDGDLYRVTGIVDEFYNPYGWPIHEYAMFYATTRASYDFGWQFLVRVEPGRASALLQPLEAALLAKYAGRNLRVRSISEVKASYFGPQRFLAKSMAILAVLLVLVTSLGIIGLSSFSVTERTRQMGTRRALGARRVDVLRYFLAENWLVTSLGLLLGAALAFALNVGLLRLVSTAQLSPLLLGVGAVLLSGLSALSSLAPALRGSKVSPALATKNV